MPAPRESDAERPASQDPVKPSPMGLALEWVARITAVSLLMFLPGVAGQWLDKRFGTEFLTLVGFAFGLIAGFVALLAMVNKKKKPSG